MLCGVLLGVVKASISVQDKVDRTHLQWTVHNVDDASLLLADIENLGFPDQSPIGRLATSLWVKNRILKGHEEPVSLRGFATENLGFHSMKSAVTLICGFHEAEFITGDVSALPGTDASSAEFTEDNRVLLLLFRRNYLSTAWNEPDQASTEADSKSSMKIAAIVFEKQYR